MALTFSEMKTKYTHGVVSVCTEEEDNKIRLKVTRNRKVICNEVYPCWGDAEVAEAEFMNHLEEIERAAEK